MGTGNAWMILCVMARRGQKIPEQQFGISCMQRWELPEFFRQHLRRERQKQ
jgi:hypothetical protein